VSERRTLRSDVVEDLRCLLTWEHQPWSRSLRTYAIVLGYLAVRPGASAVLVYRLSRALQKAHLSPLAYVLARLNHVVHGIEIPPTVDVGPGFVIYHPSGIVLHGECTVGARFRVHTGTVLGIREAGGGPVVGPPTVGDDVLIGAGAKLLGALHVGDGAHIGANAVLLQDVPPGGRATGVPATVRLPRPA
jgi:serine O-acetyltransferase